MTDKIRILIVDDHKAFRDGLRAMLTATPDLDVVGEAEDGTQAVQLALTLQPDIILMDLQMPTMNGVDATRRIVYTSPHISVIMLTMFEDDDSVFSARRAGAPKSCCASARSRALTPWASWQPAWRTNSTNR